jgi:NosR/NirI family nitrous oxide reductase transcriptional regulator
VNGVRQCSLADQQHQQAQESTHAGVLTKAEVARRFPAPLMVGDKQSDMPVWPLLRQNATANELVGYVFESIDLAPIAGFSGAPVNLLVAIDAQGGFLDVVVLSHHEPVFLDGLGEAPLLAFVKQYQGLSLRQNLQIDSKAKRGSRPDPARAYLDGVSKATASVRIINQSVLAAALKVSRKKLGFGEGAEPDQIARVANDVFERKSVAALLAEGLIAHVRLTNKDVETLFKDSPGAGLDAQALARPDAVFIDLYVALASVPTVGKNLLTVASWNTLQERLETGDHALLLLSAGRYGILGDDFVRGSIPDRMLLKQDKLPFDMRDLDLDLRLAGKGVLPAENITVLRVIGQAGLDPARPFSFSLPITRSKGIIYPERITREVPFRLQLPARFVIAAEPSDKSWRAVWRSRRAELAVLLAGVLVLGAALAMQRRLTANARAFAWFRRGFLLFTIGFIGYYAQGQLSIINLTSVIQALLAGRSLAFLLFDPMSVILWAATGLSLLIWGRGTFCGWLCPFGALQEVTGKLARWCKLPQWRLRTALDARLKWLKYPLMGAIVASACLAPALTDRLLELEPFKTAITLNFVRAWPFVAWAAGLLLLNMFVYKFFCRYLCPLGAALALLGRFRLLSWIARRPQCGAPCQTCRHRCDYQAIAASGAIVYEECFQCMDCVVIHNSDQLCAPLIMERKLRRTIPIHSNGALS